MNLKNLSLAAVISIACQDDRAPAASVVSPKVEASPVVSHPHSSIFHEPVNFEVEPSTKGFQAKFKQECDTFAQLPPNERTQDRLKDLLNRLGSWVNGQEPKGAIQKAIATQFPGQKVNVFDVTAVLNTFLHADGAHLMLQEENGIWAVSLYAFARTEAIQISDNKRSERYPVLFVDKNLCGTIPDRTEAQADPHSRVILFFMPNQMAADNEVLREVRQLPYQQPTDVEFVASQQESRLHHEATHLFLLQVHPEIVDQKTCIRDLLTITLKTGEHIQMPGCYTTEQVQELCAFSSQLEMSTNPWSHLSYLNDSYHSDESNALFADLLRVYTLDQLSLEDRRVVEQNGRIDGEQLMSVFGSGKYTLADTNAVGYRGYETCLNLTKKLSEQAKREQ